MPDDLRAHKYDTLCHWKYESIYAQIETHNTVVSIGVILQTAIMYLIHSIESNSGPGAWASVNFLQLARMSILMSDKNTTTDQFLSTAG